MSKSFVDYSDSDFTKMCDARAQDAQSPFFGKELRLYHENYFGTLYPPLSSAELNDFYANAYAKSRAKDKVKLKINFSLKRALNIFVPRQLRRSLFANRYTIDPQSPQSVSEVRAISQSAYVAENVDSGQVSRCIEFGAGNAVLSRALKKRLNIGESHIIEPSKERRENAQLPGELSHCFHAIDEVHERYDLFASSHSLEHVAELDHYLVRINDIVRDQGFIFIEVPNCDSNYYEHDGYADTHVHYFSEQSLRAIGEMMNWRVLDVSRYGPKIQEDRTALGDNIYFKNDGGLFLRVLYQKQ